MPESRDGGDDGIKFGGCSCDDDAGELLDLEQDNEFAQGSSCSASMLLNLSPGGVKGTSSNLSLFSMFSRDTLSPTISISVSRLLSTMPMLSLSSAEASSPSMFLKITMSPTSSIEEDLLAHFSIVN